MEWLTTSWLIVTLVSTPLAWILVSKRAGLVFLATAAALLASDLQKLVSPNESRTVESISLYALGAMLFLLAMLNRIPDDYLAPMWWLLMCLSLV